MVLVNLKFILSSKEEKKISFIISLSILFELYNSKRCLQKLFFWISFIQSLAYENVKGNMTLYSQCNEDHKLYIFSDSSAKGDGDSFNGQKREQAH